jgi:hypothetical protein
MFANRKPIFSIHNNRSLTGSSSKPDQSKALFGQGCYLMNTATEEPESLAPSVKQPALHQVYDSALSPFLTYGLHLTLLRPISILSAHIIGPPMDLYKRLLPPKFSTCSPSPCSQLPILTPLFPRPHNNRRPAYLKTTKCHDTTISLTSHFVLEG